MVKNIFVNVFKPRGFRKSFKFAARGIIYLFLYHRNMRIIFLAGMTAAILGFYFGLKGIELIVLCITITLVFVAEIFNTAIELMLDAITDKYHTKIRLVKDIAAGVVFITCLNAAIIGYVLFIKKLIR